MILFWEFKVLKWARVQFFHKIWLLCFWYRSFIPCLLLRFIFFVVIYPSWIAHIHSLVTSPMFKNERKNWCSLNWNDTSATTVHQGYQCYPLELICCSSMFQRLSGLYNVKDEGAFLSAETEGMSSRKTTSSFIQVYLPSDRERIVHHIPNMPTGYIVANIPPNSYRYKRPKNLSTFLILAWGNCVHHIPIFKDISPKSRKMKYW